jgi:hypothetical protein
MFAKLQRNTRCCFALHESSALLPRKAHAYMITDISSIEYVDRLVAFVDLLGWKNLVEKSANDQNLLRNITILSSAQNGMGDISSSNGIRHIRMSDASVFVADPNDEMQVHTLTRAIISIHQTALLHGWLARGCVVRGKIYFSQTSSTILGPALTTAYENAESGVAFFPRTVLDRETVELITKLYTASNNRNEFRKQFPHTNGLPILKDHDDLYFFSYLGGFMESTHKDHYKFMITRGLEENKDNPKVLQKYSWLNNYFNSVYRDSAIN